MLMVCQCISNSQAKHVSFCEAKYETDKNKDQSLDLGQKAEKGVWPSTSWDKVINLSILQMCNKCLITAASQLENSIDWLDLVINQSEYRLA